MSYQKFSVADSAPALDLSNFYPDKQLYQTSLEDVTHHSGSPSFIFEATQCCSSLHPFCDCQHLYTNLSPASSRIHYTPAISDSIKIGVHTNLKTTKSTSFDCHQCEVLPPKTFKTKNDLARHERTVHRQLRPGEAFWRCYFTDCKSSQKPWPRFDNFKAHVRRMHGEVDEDILRTWSVLVPKDATVGKNPHGIHDGLASAGVVTINSQAWDSSVIWTQPVAFWLMHP